MRIDFRGKGKVEGMEKELRKGFTTGSCSAAAAKAATFMLLFGGMRDQISITTPGGPVFHAELTDIERHPDRVQCAVVKDGGDDPDVTTGVHVTARVSIERELIELPEQNVAENVNASSIATLVYLPDSNMTDESVACTISKVPESGATNTIPADTTNRVTSDAQRSAASDSVRILIDGGTGVGRVTLPGLDQPVGNAAINRVPRQMIEKEVREVAEAFDFHGTIRVVISVPEGETVAKGTYNPRLGIEGGISILGTTGIVEPMSTKAILDTIRVELRQWRALGHDIAAVAPGNYGVQFMRDYYGYNLEQSVKCSNYIGDTIDMARSLGFRSLLLTGHIGKLIKVSGGMMNTHSHEGDAMMELLAAAVLRAGGDAELARRILDCAVTEEALRQIQASSPEIFRRTMDAVMERICYYLRKRAGDEMQVECILYSMEQGLLGESAGAAELLQEIQNR